MIMLGMRAGVRIAMATREATRVTPTGQVPTAGGDSRWGVLYRRSVLLIDGLAALSAAALGAALRPESAPPQWNRVVSPLSVVLLPVLWTAVLAMVRDHHRQQFRGFGDDCRDVAIALGGILTLFAVLTSLWHVSWPTPFVVALLLGSSALTLLGRVQAARTLRVLRRRGKCLHRILAVGRPAAVRAIADEISRQPSPVAEVVGCCLPDTSRLGPMPLPIQVYRGIDHVSSAAEAVRADVVAVLPCQEVDGAVLRRLTRALEGRPWQLMIIPCLTDVDLPRLAVTPIGNLPGLHVRRTRVSGPSWKAKLGIEWLLALVAVLVTAPLLIGIATAVRLTSPGPALFRQVRVGRHGRLFLCLKFRTMHPGAQHRRHELRMLNINSDGLLFKVRDDPRVTPAGAVLRRWSLDELPQLFNILAGHMSLVGPRPALPAEAVRYDDEVRRRLLVKPGLTGLWQVSGRSNLSWHDAVRLDLQYVDNWSLGLDARILSRTAFAVLHRTGAY
jgi:exopolysaccharide biosynthesis polyprenyl glycosylphosphotransferase